MNALTAVTTNLNLPRNAKRDVKKLSGTRLQRAKEKDTSLQVESLSLNK